MVRVSLYGQGMGQVGWPQPPQDSVEGGAQPRGGTGWVQAQLPHPVPSCRCQHASSVGLGGLLEAEGGVSWLPGGCTSQLSPCSTTHRSVLEPLFSCAPPKQVLTLDTPQPHIGAPTIPLALRVGVVSQSFHCGCSSLLSTLGKMWCPDAAARSSAVRDSRA